MALGRLLHLQIDADLNDVERQNESNGHYRPTIDGQRLHKRHKISYIWPKQPSDELLHVFVRRPPRVLAADGARGECATLRIASARF